MALANRPTSAGWYLVSFGLIGTAIAIALTGWNQMVEVVSTMQRTAMPGTHEIAIAGGMTTIYYEHRARIGDHEYESAPDLKFACAVRDQTGKPLQLRHSAGSTTYNAGGFAGRNVFDVDINVPGAYVIACDGDPGKPYVVAVGGGIGAWFVVAIVGGSLPGIAGILVVVFVTLKRRRWFAKNRGDAADE